MSHQYKNQCHVGNLGSSLESQPHEGPDKKTPLMESRQNQTGSGLFQSGLQKMLVFTPKTQQSGKSLKLLFKRKKTKPELNTWNTPSESWGRGEVWECEGRLSNILEGFLFSRLPCNDTPNTCDPAIHTNSFSPQPAVLWQVPWPQKFELILICYLPNFCAT